MPMRPVSRRCGAPNCSNMTDVRTWSAFCTQHMHSMHLHGTLRGCPKFLFRELAPHLQSAERALLKFRNRSATRVAHEIAQAILDFEPERPFRHHLGMQENMQRLRAGGVTAGELLQCVLAFVFLLEERPGRFYGSQTAEDIVLGRVVLRLRVSVGGRNRKYPTRKIMRLVAEHCRALYPYCSTVVRKLAELDAQHAKRIKASCDLDAVEGGDAK